MRITDKELALPFTVAMPVLGLGSQVKNTLCLLRGGRASISRIHADLSLACDLADFERDAAYYLKERPGVIAYDLHPDYQSTRKALSLSVPQGRGPGLAAVQHHHAHIASCMLENGLKNKLVIGVAFDGTGFGSDGTLWGAEFLVSDYKGFTRAAHLAQIPLLGGERAIQEPWRLAAAYLQGAFGDDFLRLKLPLVRRIDKKKWRTLQKMYAGSDKVLASSAGRLFDAAGSIIFTAEKVSAEAELPVRMEKAAAGFCGKAAPYRFAIRRNAGALVLDTAPLFKQIVEAVESGKPSGLIAYAFHLTVAEMIKTVSVLLRKKYRTNTVVLSGGVFQNNLLLRLASDLLYKEGFQLIRHRLLSCADSSISLGQAAVAYHNRPRPCA